MSSPPPSPYPWLVLIHEHNKLQTFYDLSRRSINIKSVPELQGLNYKYSYGHGWLVLQRQKGIIHLWNPLTLTTIVLPYLSLNQKERINGMVLTMPPENPYSFLVVFVFSDVRRSNIYVCRINDVCRRWFQTELRIGREKDLYLDIEAVYCGGRIYAFCDSSHGHRDNRFPIEIDIVQQPQHCRTVITSMNWARDQPRSEKGVFSVRRVESCGEIFSVEVEFGGAEKKEVTNVAIFRLDFVQMEWKRIKTLLNKVFFLDHRKAHCYPADSDKLRNKVFITVKGSYMLYTYDMKDQLISMSAPFQEVPPPSSKNSPCWVLPGKVPQAWSDGPNQGHQMLQKASDGPNQGHMALQTDQKTSSEKKDFGEYVLQLEDLSDNVFDEVFKYLDPFAYLSFRAVNTRLRDVAPPKLPIEKIENITSPWLICPNSFMSQTKSNLASDDDVSHFSLLDPKHGADQKCYLTRPEITTNARVLYSSYGWLLMVGEFQTTGMFLYKPLTKEIILLPQLLPETYPKFVFFLSSPDSPDNLVVAVCQNHLRAAQIRPKTMNEWEFKDGVNFSDEVKHTYQSLVYCSQPSHCYPIVNDNTLYFFGRDENLYSFSVDDHDSDAAFNFFAFKVRKPMTVQNMKTFLVACDGELLTVIVSITGEESVKVFKLSRQGITRFWNEVNDLGNYCLYLSNLSTCAVKSDDPDMKNRIYFTRFYGESMVYYSMETRKLHYTWIQEGKVVVETLDDFFECKEALRSFWFEPR